MAASDSTTRDELAAAFKGVASLHEQEDAMQECLSLMRLYDLTPKDLFYKYEAFLFARPAGLRAKLSKFNIDVARELRRELQRQSQAKAVAATASGTPSGVSKAAGVRKKGAGLGDLDGILGGFTTPVRPKQTRPVASTGSVARLSNAGNNANLPSPAGTFGTPSRSPAGATPRAYIPGGSSLGTSSLLAPPSVTPVGKSGGTPSSPTSGTESPNMLTPQSTVPFHLRPQPHVLLEKLNGHLTSGDGAPPGSAKPRVQLSIAADPKDWNYRYMFEKISARSEALDEQIDDFGEVIREAYELTDLGDPHLVSEEDIYTVGRVLAAPTDTAKASINSLYLQSSRMMGSGKCISLAFPNGGLKVRGGAPGVRGFGVFPGALVCLKGRNGGRNAFVVSEVLMPPPSPLSPSPISELIEYQQGERLGGLPFSMYTAAGPYTLESNLLYEPLDALVEVACDERPDVLVLQGPFVDAAHPDIVSGKLSVTPTELFREQVAGRLARINEVSPATIIILIPSVRDMISRHVAYPQSMLEREGLGLSKKIKLLPNPCTFSINEVVISVATTDVLFHLRSQEIFQRAEEAEPDPTTSASGNPQGDPMANAVRHVLGQRHFYPLFPAPENVAHEVNLDVTHWHLLRMSDAAPDVLILPSKLKHFSKIVDSSLVVNPGFLSRPHSAGTFAKMTIHPSPPEKLGGDDVDMDGEWVEHGVWERARSEVWRI